MTTATLSAPVTASRKSAATGRAALFFEPGKPMMLTEFPVVRAEDRVAAVRSLTNGWGADVVCELVGFSEVIPEGLRMPAVGGRYLEIGTFYPGHPIDLDPGRLVAANHRIEAVMLYDAPSVGAAVDFLARNAARLPL